MSHIFLRFTKSNRNRSIGTCRALQQNIDVYRATRILTELISTDLSQSLRKTLGAYSFWRHIGLSICQLTRKEIQEKIVELGNK